VNMPWNSTDLPWKAGGGADTVDNLLANDVSSTSSVTAPALVDVPPASNLLTQPSAFDHADWTKTNCTIDDNSTTDPDSTTLADTLIENTDTNLAHGVSQQITKAASSKTYNFSVCAKLPVTPNPRNRISITISDLITGASSGRFAAFDVAGGLADGTAVAGFGATFSGGTKAIADLTNGWWRCELNGVTTGTETTLAVTVHLEVGSGTDIRDVTYDGIGNGMYLYEAILVEA
jgi:hypothetical protein